MTATRHDELETLRARVEELSDALRRSEARLATILESLPFDLWVMDEEGRYVLQNETSKRHWGEAIGMRPETALDISLEKERVASRWEENNRRAFAGETVRGEVSYDLEGETRHYVEIITPVLDGSRVRGILGVNIDVTDTKRLVTQIERAQRIESLSLFAAGIAHDFNNTLLAVMGATSVLQRELGANERASALLAEVDTACLAARGLTRQLQTFARAGPPERRIVALPTLLAETIRMMLRGTSTKSDLQVEQGLWSVEADEAQLRQVFQNLVLNASQAMQDAGEVRVRATNTALASMRGGKVGPGRFVLVEVEDNGPGIPPEKLGRIFEPYFSTKEQGRGLGLAVVQSIVERHGGAVFATSSEDRGTRMEVYLPAQ